MNRKKFNISLMFNKDGVIPISKKVIQYIEDLLVDELLIKNRIIVNSQWSYLFSFFLSDAKINQIILHVIQEVPLEKTKACGALCPAGFIDKEMPTNVAYINLLLKSLEIFFTKNFKKITVERFSEFQNTIDFSYLYSLPYPAPEADQSYNLMVDFDNDPDVIRIG